MMPILLLFAVLQNAPAESIDALWNSANADMQAQHWSEAAAKYEQVLKQDGTHVPSLFSLAVCYTNLNEPKRAAGAYSKLLEQDGAVFEARINYAWLLQRSGDNSAADEQMDKAIALRPDDPKTDMIAASFFTAENHFDRAYTHLQQAERKGLLTPELLIALSQAEARLNNETKSREYLERAAQLDPNNRDLLHDLGVAYRKAGQFDKAIATLQPLLPDTRLELALSFFSNKNYTEAGKLFEELARLEPANADYLYMLGQSHLENKRYADAVGALTRLLALQPNYVEAYATLGSVRYLQEDWAGAATALLKFLEFKPNHPFSHFVLATCFDKLGNLKEALVHYNRFLALDDGSSDVRSFQARQRAKALEARLR
jgi:tetratricopeptide (TPR) repeat protein